MVIYKPPGSGNSVCLPCFLYCRSGDTAYARKKRSDSSDSSGDSPGDSSESSFFGAKGVLDRRINEEVMNEKESTYALQGITEFLVEWEDGSTPNWEPEENLTMALIEEYEERLDSEDELMFDLDSKSHFTKSTRFMTRLTRISEREEPENGRLKTISLLTKSQMIAAILSG